MVCYLKVIYLVVNFNKSIIKASRAQIIQISPVKQDICRLKHAEKWERTKTVRRSLYSDGQIYTCISLSSWSYIYISNHGTANFAVIVSVL